MSGKKTQNMDTLREGPALHQAATGCWWPLSLLLAAVTVAATLYVPILTGDAVDLIVGPGQVDFAGLLAILLAGGGGHRHHRPVPVGDEPHQQPDHLPGGAGHPQRGLPARSRACP